MNCVTIKPYVTMHTDIAVSKAAALMHCANIPSHRMCSPIAVGVHPHPYYTLLQVSFWRTFGCM